MNPELDDDVLPQAPASTGQAAPVETADVDASVYDSVAKMGDVIPAGTFHFRLDSWQKANYEDGPVYSITWRCQEEPHTGRVVFSNCPWPKREDIDAAKNPTHPDRVGAQQRVSQRLVTAKELQTKAGVKPGTMPFEEFLNTHPEMKLQISVTAKKERQPDGSFKNAESGEMKNKIQKYLELNPTRPQ